MHFYQVFIAYSIYSFRYVYHIFISYISYSSTYHLIYSLSNGSYYISSSVHVIFIYIYYFHGYILYHLLCSIFMYCYHLLFSRTVIMYCVHVLISYIVFMYCFMYCSYTVSCTIYVLFMYCVHVLISYTVFLFSCFTFHITFSFMPLNTKEVDKGNYKGPKALYSLCETVVYHSTLSLRDNHDRVFSILCNRTFRLTPRVSYTHT